MQLDRSPVREAHNRQAWRKCHGRCGGAGAPTSGQERSGTELSDRPCAEGSDRCGDDLRGCLSADGPLCGRPLQVRHLGLRRFSTGRDLLPNCMPRPLLWSDLSGLLPPWQHESGISSSVDASGLRHLCERLP